MSENGEAGETLGSLEVPYHATYRSASSAGIVSWRVGASVNTCPVTLARMVRVSSCSSTPLHYAHPDGVGVVVSHALRNCRATVACRA